MSFIETDTINIQIGVVGIGLMGSSIIVSLLVAGHQVIAIAPIPADLEGAEDRIIDQLNACQKAGLLKKGIPHYLDHLKITRDYGCLSSASLVLECVVENLDIKSHVYKRISDVVSDTAIIATNTSAIPITLLQRTVENPERFIGIHWAEPAYATRFLEIACGESTDSEYADWVYRLAHKWGKEPTLLRKNIRGLITNRLMYAVYREIFHLVENGETTIEDADKAFRYDVGSWITLMGLFRRLDYTGIEKHSKIFKNIFPRLSNSDNVPYLMQKIVEENGRGIQNLRGLYPYTSNEAKEWEAAFGVFNEDIFRLAALYPAFQTNDQD